MRFSIVILSFNISGIGVFLPSVMRSIKPLLLQTDNT